MVTRRDATGMMGIGFGECKPLGLLFSRDSTLIYRVLNRLTIKSMDIYHSL